MAMKLPEWWGVEDWALWTGAGMFFLFLTLGCNTPYRFATQGNDQETLAASWVMKRSAELGLEVQVLYSSTARLVCSTPDGSGVRNYAAMWALVRQKQVVIWTGITEDPERYPSEVLDGYAKHEACHLLRGHGRDPEHTEVLAEDCVKEHWP